MSEKKTTPYADFGKRLTKLREEKGMTKQELAGLCGIAPSTEANYESGLRIPQADTAVLMAQVFEISVEELLGVDDPEVEFCLVRDRQIPLRLTSTVPVRFLQAERFQLTTNSTLSLL